MSYLTIARELELKELIKGSSFVARLKKVADVSEARAFLEKTSRRFPDATHHCWAYRIDDAYRFSDDGEPGGTAGRPMLEVLTRRQLNRVMAVVTRYYGGTKLGAGGLVRAYGGTLAKALDLAGVTEVKPRSNVVLKVPFAHMDAVHRFLNAWPELQKGEVTYDEKGMVLQLSLLQDQRDSFNQDLRNISRGEASLLFLAED